MYRIFIVIKSVTNLNKKTMKLKIKLFLVAVLSVFCFYSCSTDDNPVPQVQVDFYIHFNNAQYSALQNPGGWVYVTGGYQGIFIYNFNNETYYAFDRACTYDYHHSPLIYNEKTHCLEHSDTTENCSSKFDVLLQGAVHNGPAKFALREYDVLVYGGYLRVLNGLGY